MILRTASTGPVGWPSDSDWSPVLERALRCPGFRSLQEFLVGEREQHTVYPPVGDVFNAFRFSTLANTKVVILGQDPYHGPGQAHGLSFSVAGGGKLPPSLKNIFKELATDLEVPAPVNGDLSIWAEQGVLLLNTVLTVRAGQANSHAKRGWEEFTDFVMGYLGQQTQTQFVFVLWGKSAERKSNLIHPSHTIIASPHPSPLSAYRGFFGSRPFSRTNAALEAMGKTPIRWY